jgi:hypothetical protein
MLNVNKVYIDKGTFIQYEYDWQKKEEIMAVENKTSKNVWRSFSHTNIHEEKKFCRHSNKQNEFNSTYMYIMSYWAGCKKLS